MFNRQQYGPLFSFNDYYQDFINDIGYFADPEDQEEMKILRENLVVDPHIQEISLDATLFGYNLQSCEKREDFSLDFIINHDMQRTDHDND